VSAWTDDAVARATTVVPVTAGTNSGAGPRHHGSAASGESSDRRGTTQRVVMGLRRVWSAHERGSAPLEGVQFHPESFLTDEGPRLLRNFLDM
jgi:anthranilate/para-aminobenzoate synthase component II